MDPGQGWTRGNRKWQRAPRVRRVAEKNTSKEPEPQKSSPGWLGVTPPEPRFLQRLGQHRYPPASRGLLCFQILHLKAESETPLSSRGGQALGSVGYLLPSLPRGWAQRGLRGQAAARSAPDASGSSVAAQPAPCESRPPPPSRRGRRTGWCETPALGDGPVPGPRHSGRGLEPACCPGRTA